MLGDMTRLVAITAVAVLSLSATPTIAKGPPAGKPRQISAELTIKRADGAVIHFVPGSSSKASLVAGATSVPTETDLSPCLTRSYQDFGDCNITDKTMASTDYGMGYVTYLDGTTPYYHLAWQSAGANLTSTYQFDERCPQGWYFDSGGVLAGDEVCWSPGILYTAWPYPAHPAGAYTFYRSTTYGALANDTATVKSGKLEVDSGNAQSTLIGYQAQAPLVIALRDYRGNRVHFPVNPETSKANAITFSVTGPRNSTGQSVEPSSKLPDTVGLASVTIRAGGTAGQYTITATSLDATPLAPSATLTAVTRKEPDDHPEDEEGDGKDCSVADPISIGIGNSFQQETDYRKTGLSILEFQRSYNALGSKSKLTHNYWTTTFDRQILLPVAPITTVRVRRPDGRIVGFVPQSGSYQSFRPYNHGTLRTFGTGWQYITEDNTTETYNSAGLWTTIVDAQGRSLTAAYDSKSQLTKVVANTGESLTLAYSSYGQVSSVTDQAGRIWTYAYNGFANLTQVKDPDGVYHTYHYESPYSPYLLTGTSVGRNAIPYASERVATWEFGADGRATANYFANGLKRFDIVYNDVTNERVVADGLGNQTIYKTRTLYGRGFVDGVVGPGFSTCGLADAEIQRDPFQNVLSRTAFGRKTQYDNYDAKGQYASMIQAAGTPAARQTTYVYDTRFLNKPTIISEPSVDAGHVKTTQIAYNPAGDVIQYSVSGFRPDGTPVSRSVTMQYNGPYGQISLVDGPRNDVPDITRFDYDTTTKRLLRVTDPSGTILRDHITYTATGQVATEDRPNGQRVTYVYYTGTDLLKSITQAGGGVTRTTMWGYDDRHFVGSITHGDGINADLVTQFEYNAAGDITSVISPGAGRINYIYDAAGNRTRDSYKDSAYPFAERRWIQRTFDAYGRVKDLINPFNSSSVEFHPDGSLTRATDGQTNTSSYSYDDFKRMTQLIQPGQFSTTFGYDIADRLTRVTDANQSTTTQAYDDLGNRIRLTSPDTGVTSFAFDNGGDLVQSTNALGENTIYLYDANSRLVSVDRVGVEDDETYIYGGCLNGVGRLCSATNGIGDYVRYEYDSLGLISKQSTNAGAVSYQYDSKGNVTAITYPSQRQVRYTRNTAEQVTDVSVMDGGNTYVLARAIQRLPFGPATGWIYGNGLAESRQYDLQYRPMAFNSGNQSAVVYTGYDGNNNYAQRTVNGDVQAFSYNGLGRLDTASGAFGTRDYGYDPVGNRISQNAGGQNTLYAYEPGSNRLVSDTSWTYGRDANGNETRRRTADGHGWDLVYSATNRLIAITDLQNPNTTYAAYRYNALGQRTIKSTPYGDTRFVFGLQGELLAEALPDNSVTQEYVYLDGTPIALLGAPTAPATPFAVDQIVDNPASNAGCNIKKASIAVNGSYLYCTSTSLQWPWTPPVTGDYDVTVHWAWNSNCQRYRFSPDIYEYACIGQEATAGSWLSLGRRHLTGGVASPTLVYNDNVGLASLNMDAIRYVLVHKDLTDRDYSYVHTDALGTPLRVTDKTGVVVWTAAYDPFGAAVVNDDPDGNGVHQKLNMRFPGQYFDAETELHYNYFRDYDPTLGRYLQSDPIGLSGGVNTYFYARGNSIKYVDPLGLDVTIIISNRTYSSTGNSVEGTIFVTSDRVETTFSGYTMENSHAGSAGNKSPIPAGTYDAFPRTDHTPNRIELIGVDGYQHIQIHNGSYPQDFKGCFGAGTTQKIDFLGNTRSSMNQINSIIQQDGTGDITVIVGLIK
jgi:RHS repeat-associated protein